MFNAFASFQSATKVLWRIRAHVVSNSSLRVCKELSGPSWLTTVLFHADVWYQRVAWFPSVKDYLICSEGTAWNLVFMSIWSMLKWNTCVSKNLNYYQSRNKNHCIITIELVLTNSYWVLSSCHVIWLNT